MDGKENITHRCGECKGYNANYCNTYDEVTKEDSEVRCIGFDPSETCGGCCYYDQPHCEFYGCDKDADTAACNVWEPKIEM